jgi:hypothetical protein
VSWRAPLPAACWADRAVSAVIPVEAETPPDAVFLATHSRLPILQRQQVKLHEGQVVDEAAVLRAVSDQPADYPVLPVLGPSGAGKSHLVRWLRLNLHLEEHTRLVFVPKHKTSLRGILDLVLQHVDEERSRELRGRVARAVDSFGSEQEARLRLRSELATLIETRGGEGSTSPDDEQELRIYLASALPALLLDPWFKKTLLADESAVARLVREKLFGRDQSDKEDAFGFSPADVRLSVDDVRQASLEAQEVAGALASDEQLPVLAARMLNEQLSQAVSSVFGLGGDDLKNILVDLRLDLAQRGQDLLLLIEDFSIFQGIQGGLIDAITLVPTQELAVCPMRVVMAVTTGYFMDQLPDTVKTRTHIAFDLDLPVGAQERPDPASFAAPYLNAVRVGSEALQQWNGALSDMPNACTRCPVTAECHAAFGEVDGIGLFPFNRAALQKAVRSQSSSDGRFIARDVLNRVLRPVLHRDRAAVDAGNFPTTAFARDFASGAEGVLDIEDEAALERAEDPAATNERRKRLVRFWSSLGGAQNLDKTIHDAFDVPTVAGLVRQSSGPIKKPDDASPVARPAVKPPRTEVPQLVAEVDRWIETGDMRQAERNDLRRLVHALVLERLNFQDGLWRDAPWTDPSKIAPGFAATGVVLGTRRGGAERGVELHLEGGGSPDARAVRALAWYSKTGSWRLINNGAVLQRLAHRKVEEWAERVSAQLFPQREQQPEVSAQGELVALVHALELSAQVLGVASAFRDDLADRVAALVQPEPEDGGAGWPRLDKLRHAARTGAVPAAADRKTLRTRLLRLASFSQDGMPLGLDVPRLAAALRSSPTLPVAGAGLPDDVRRYIAVLDAEVRAAGDLDGELRAVLPDLTAVAPDFPEAVAGVEDLLERLATFDLLPHGLSIPALRQASRDVKPGDVAAVQRMYEKLSAWPTLERRDRLKALSGDWYPAALRLQAYMNLAEDALLRVERRLNDTGDSKLQAEALDAAQQLDAVLADVLVALRALISGPEVVA